MVTSAFRNWLRATARLINELGIYARQSIKGTLFLSQHNIKQAKADHEMKTKQGAYTEVVKAKEENPSLKITLSTVLAENI